MIKPSTIEWANRLIDKELLNRTIAIKSKSAFSALESAIECIIKEQGRIKDEKNKNT